jgi:anti-sigma regulatory factor (Ser/Thr protein kinase)
MVRRALSSWLRDVECSAATSRDVILVVSELVTNAVVHAGSVHRVVAALVDARLRIEVYDRDSRPPRLRPDGGPNGGFGLRIVAALADGWGWLPTRSGKLVWTEVRC